MNHNEAHPYAGKTVLLKTEVRDPSGTYPAGTEYRIEDWNDRVLGGSWMYADGNISAFNYAIRSVTSNVPLDNEVVYGKIGGLGYLVHVSELDLETVANG